MQYWLVKQEPEDKILKNIPLVKQSRLSVLPLTAEQFARVLKLAETKPP